MAIRNSDYNLDGEFMHSIPLGELHSKQALAVTFPEPEHKTLTHYFKQLNDLQQNLNSYDVDETDEDFFDFGEDDFDDDPTRAEALFESLYAWREKRANKPSETATGGETAPKEVEPLKEEAPASSSHSVGSEA